jgi:hypothetical protein
MATNLTGLKLLLLFFLWRNLKDRMLQKNSKIPGLKTAIQTETEVMSAETLTKVLSNFVFRMHKFRDLGGHNMENVLMQQTNF